MSSKTGWRKPSSFMMSLEYLFAGNTASCREDAVFVAKILGKVL